MGLFSYNCSLSGIEVASPFCGSPSWMNQIVVVTKDTTWQGSYDGYGRVVTESGETICFFEDEAAVVLSRFYNSETYDVLSPSTHSEHQGHFFPDGYFQEAEQLALEIH